MAQASMAANPALKETYVQLKTRMEKAVEDFREVLLPDALRAKRKALARAEIEHLVDLLGRQPIGVQIGIVPDTLPHLGFQLLRQPDRKVLVMTPFRLGVDPNVRVGVSMITSAPDAIAMHEDAINDMWKRALKGDAAAECLHNLLKSNGEIRQSRSPRRR